ncbi:Cu(I)-responsive transcriptional regulator [Hoeflea alexandrii]|jgi:Cu(I)-responsive transcriptional regulator|uniref:Cu(I)-responsive transcriptional regulator n=1 Tax=Hoeflea alexandrii TaxID=288436 RepID=A0ABT1CXV1_9HYPH|nr:Cu(I)-responsive transcriptional regulator [Hoeflea alexandrii]MCO6411030.1 Cu(I)-responsive transcriptional regulator [Hoeflea alexandrii]MCY0151109.1 Cu(I)-responsive transcriptional regulator [Hoeflea alexandrii]
MNIGEAADMTGLPAKTIRYYEDIGLIRPARAANGYRDYDDKDVHRLAFIQRSRSLGFTIDECRSLLSLYEDKERASSDVKALAMDKIREIDRKLLELKSLRGTLKTLADNCHGDDRPDCPIINEIAGGTQA